MGARRRADVGTSVSSGKRKPKIKPFRPRQGSRMQVPAQLPDDSARDHGKGHLDDLDMAHSKEGHEHESSRHR